MKKSFGLALISSACFAHAQLEPAQNFMFTNSVQNTVGGDVTTVFNNFGFGGSLGSEVPAESLTYTPGVVLPDGSTDTVLNLNFMDFLKIEHGIAPNGGSYVNSYSVVMDVKVPEENTWIPLFQTNTNNSNDGDYWIRDSDSFWGVSGDYVGPALDRSRWNRIVAVIELTSTLDRTITTYVNGEFIRTQVVEIAPFAQDDRWSLDPQILILADNDGESPTTAQLANLAIFGRALTGAEAQYLGESSANTIVMSQPLTGTLELSNTVGSFAAPIPISYTFLQGATEVYSGVAEIASSSTAVDLEIPKYLNGDYTVVIDGGPFLKVSGPATLSGSGLNLGTITLVNGDVDASGEVDAADIDLVIANFGETFPGGTGDSNSDVDQSGEVDAADIDIVIANFGATDL